MTVSEEYSIWLLLTNAKSSEAWLAILGGSAYVWYKSGAKSKFAKAIEAGISGLISVGLGEDVISITSYPPALVHFAVAVFSFAILDFSTSLFADKEELTFAFKAFVCKWLGIELKNMKKSSASSEKSDTSTPTPVVAPKHKSNSEDQ